jgi:hypothetical protein
MKAILVFPPNWSACVAGPHLALPLLAGCAKAIGWEAVTLDLSEEFYRTVATPPSRDAIVKASLAEDFDELDRLYFKWEDQLCSAPSAGDGASGFGLLSGYPFRAMRELPLAEAARLTEQGTVYTGFYRERVLPRLSLAKPAVVGVTIASQEQMIPAVELLQLVRQALPDTFLILGGNIVTRLRGTTAFHALKSLADQTAVFQGELGFTNTLKAVSEFGVEKARRRLPQVIGDQQIAYNYWPVPSFSGIEFDRMVGVPMLPYVSTRGCYWGRCPFCAIPAGWSEKGYAGSAPADFVADQLFEMFIATGIPRVKFVDEAFPPSKVRPLADCLRQQDVLIEWEAYARLEPSWEDEALLEAAYKGGLRKLYFGLEQAPTANRHVFGKNDRGKPLRILENCNRVGIKVHLFCMVGHPGTTRDDAMVTVRFLLDHQHLIDTADLVGFRLDRGTTVPRVRAIPNSKCDWEMAMKYEPTEEGVLTSAEVDELEVECQEILWENCPRLLHPLYRLAGNWSTAKNTMSSPFFAEQRSYA